MDLKTVYERQREAQFARELVYEIEGRVYWEMDARSRTTAAAAEHADVLAQKAIAEALEREVAELRAEVGGKVYRVGDFKLEELAARIAKLNKKAAKLGTGAITLTVSDEKGQFTYKDLDNRERVTDYTFVTVTGETPMLPGWVFVATLDHEADMGAEESTGIRRAPITDFLVNRLGRETADLLETADLTRYRHAGPDCDHCRLDRRRKQTYVLLETAKGELRQVGTNCLADYTGAHNPDRVATWAEWLWALDRDLGTEGSDDFFGSEGGGRVAIATDEYLANVAVMIRENGWLARWRRSDYGDMERNEDSTADMAHRNITNYGKRDRQGTALWVDPVAEDYELARATLEWVREDLAERDGLDEYQHNLVTYCRSNYLPEKGDGFIASAINARKRELGQILERERKVKLAETSEWFGDVKQRIKGLTLTVTFTREFDSAYGVRVLTKGYTPEGNGVVWWGKGGLDQGRTYQVDATVKAHETDQYNGGGKVTQVSNVRGIIDVTEEEA